MARANLFRGGAGRRRRFSQGRETSANHPVVDLAGWGNPEDDGIP